MSRIDSLFKFIGEKLRSVTTGYKILNERRNEIWVNETINIDTGITAYTYTRVSTPFYLEVSSKVEVAVDEGFNFSLRCYDSEKEYLTPSPTPEFVSGTRVFDISEMPTGTAFVRFEVKNDNDTNISAASFDGLRYNNHFVIPGSESDGLLRLKPGYGVLIEDHDESDALEIGLAYEIGMVQEYNDTYPDTNRDYVYIPANTPTAIGRCVIPKNETDKFVAYRLIFSAAVCINYEQYKGYTGIRIRGTRQLENGTNETFVSPVYYHQSPLTKDTTNYSYEQVTCDYYISLLPGEGPIEFYGTIWTFKQSWAKHIFLANQVVTVTPF